MSADSSTSLSISLYCDYSYRYKSITETIGPLDTASTILDKHPSGQFPQLTFNGHIIPPNTLLFSLNLREGDKLFYTYGYEYYFVAQPEGGGQLISRSAMFKSDSYEDYFEIQHKIAEELMRNGNGEQYVPEQISLIWNDGESLSTLLMHASTHGYMNITFKVMDAGTRSVTLYYRQTGTRVDISVPTLISAEDLKNEISAATHIPPECLSYQIFSIPNASTDVNYPPLFWTGSTFTLYITDTRLPEPTLKLTVRPLQGTPLSLSSYSTDTIECVKERIYKQRGIPPHQQRLVFLGKQLEDSRTLQEYNISDSSTIYLALHLRG